MYRIKAVSHKSDFTAFLMQKRRGYDKDKKSNLIKLY